MCDYKANNGVTVLDYCMHISQQMECFPSLPVLPILHECSIRLSWALG